MLRCRILLGPPGLLIYESVADLERVLNPKGLADLIA